MYPKHEVDPRDPRLPRTPGDAGLSRRSLLAAGGAAAATTVFPHIAFAQSSRPASAPRPRFVRVPTQFIAALADPGATAGRHAESWGLWEQDPGPRGVDLQHYERLKAEGVAPAGWHFDPADWWLEEHGLIMEQPRFPLPPRQYMVTGDRDVRTVLTVHPMGSDGTQAWELADGATVHDVTHLRCRSARYTPGASACSPANAPVAAFPVRPGAAMPPVEGCSKQDYSVLIVLGVALEDA